MFQGPSNTLYVKGASPVFVLCQIDRRNVSVSLCAFVKCDGKLEFELKSNLNWFQIVGDRCDKQIRVAQVDRLLADTGSFFETSLFKVVQTFSVLPPPTLPH